jgi:predicted DNA-binding transcriptional regulator AlpA
MHQQEIDLRSPKEIADLLGITVTCLIAWRRTGRGPTFARIGTRKVAYDMRDVKAWLDSHKQRASGSAKAVARTMPAPNCGKPATEATVNGLQEVDRLAELINLQARPFLRSSQAVRCKRTLCAGRIVVRRSRGRSQSILVYIWRSEPFCGAVSGGAS